MLIKSGQSGKKLVKWQKNVTGTYTEKPWGHGRAPTTNSTHTWGQAWESNPWARRWEAPSLLLIVVLHWTAGKCAKVETTRAVLLPCRSFNLLFRYNPLLGLSSWFPILKRKSNAWSQVTEIDPSFIKITWLKTGSWCKGWFSKVKFNSWKQSLNTRPFQGSFYLRMCSGVRVT